MNLGQHQELEQEAEEVRTSGTIKGLGEEQQLAQQLCEQGDHQERIIGLAADWK